MNAGLQTEKWVLQRLFQQQEQAMSTTNFHELKQNWQGREEQRSQLRQLLEERRNEAEGHGDWAGFCEQVGEDALAVQEYRLSLRDEPSNCHAMRRLVVLLPERGENDEALKWAERWFQQDPASPESLDALLDLCLAADLPGPAREALEKGRQAGQDPARLESWMARLKAKERETGPPRRESEDDEPGGLPSDSEVVRFAHLFAGRENLYARQWWDPGGKGGYTPVKQPFTFTVARNHLLGSLTVGIYPVRLDNTVSFMAFDLDINKRALEKAIGDLEGTRRLKRLIAAVSARLMESFQEMEIPVLMEDSGYKGRHFWIFLESNHEASLVRHFGQFFMQAFPLDARELHLEFFPKQDNIEGGVGNLIKLPLGIPRGEEIIPVPPPPPLPPAWTSAHFETHAEISCLLTHCAVLAELKRQAEEKRQLGHDEQVVLAHSMGHTAAGVQAVNYIHNLCVNVSASSSLQSPLAGNPISCPKIRKRIPQVTARVKCHCLFDFAPDHYPTPRLHLERPGFSLAPAEMVEAAWDPAAAVQQWGVLRRKQEELQKEMKGLEERLLQHLEDTARNEIALADGRLVLVREDGCLPALAWKKNETPFSETGKAMLESLPLERGVRPSDSALSSPDAGSMVPAMAVPPSDGSL